MEDSRIIELFFERSEEALAETEARYRAYCFSIALRIGDSFYRLLQNTFSLENLKPIEEDVQAGVIVIPLE